MNRFHILLVLLVLLPLLSVATYLILIDDQVGLIGAGQDRAGQDRADQNSGSWNSGSPGEFRRSLVRNMKKLSALPFSIALFLLIAGGSVPLVILFLITGFAVRRYENEAGSRLSKEAKSEMANELPAIAEVFSILVSGGESLPVALDRISRRASGSLALVMRSAVSKMRSGTGLVAVLDLLAQESGVPEVRRFCDSLIVALERGTPLSDVLARQINEIRAHQHAKLITVAGRAEVGLLIPVVFLILPISVLFALWPSYLSLNLNIGA